MSGVGYPTRKEPAPRPPRKGFREQLWEFVGYPDDETPERRRILHAIVALRLGLGLFFLLRGWGAVFAAPAGAFASRLGDPARLGLGGLAADTVLFILGCTEIGIGLLLIAGAFTRVSATVGSLLLLLALVLGDFSSLDPCAAASDCTRRFLAFARFADAVPALYCLFLGGLLVVVVGGSPFLSADRALDKLEEEERDRAPAVLPTVSRYSVWFMRGGLLLGAGWLVVRSWPLDPLYLVLSLFLLGLLMLAPPALAYFAVQLLIDAVRLDMAMLIPLACGFVGIGVAALYFQVPLWPLGRRGSPSIRVRKTE